MSFKTITKQGSVCSQTYFLKGGTFNADLLKNYCILYMVMMSSSHIWRAILEMLWLVSIDKSSTLTCCNPGNFFEVSWVSRKSRVAFRLTCWAAVTWHPHHWHLTSSSCAPCSFISGTKSVIGRAEKAGKCFLEIVTPVGHSSSGGRPITLQWHIQFQWNGNQQPAHLTVK